MKDETEEWLDELVRSWTETFKKSLTTLELMRAVAALDEVAVARTGAKRKDYSLTTLGVAYLERIEKVVAQAT